MTSLFQRHGVSGITTISTTFATPMTIESDPPPAATVLVIERGKEKKAEVPPIKKRLTTKYGTKYEKARLLGEWATRISQGVDPCVDLSKLPEKERSKYTDPLLLAQKALADKTMPLGIRRFLEDGSYEDWFLDELVFLM